ncbi:FMN reductase [Rhizobium ruizarguesonis]|uniref:FMN reductase n=1 Tax=Rhizobium ruizarguesonis TaxID=2081791 RepID=UPI00102FC566|nr:FMN reductase [Rhizobium ruizarguesonis]QIJ43640.1 FMN reductase [Rhizobium leguminosarum]NEK10195.1 FMN reductase [Rhizobium ruizarguesonis]TAW69059.1 FMN reductase [Rhizobium ruizarguesonis]TAX05231.1 FMN reductase [Rhizobium ruizarguesonis]TAX07805.1 FMN reductase [Rhizobium ruizarguesonis]
MSNDLIVGFSGNLSRPSSTRRFVESVAESLAKQAGLQHAVFDVEDLGTSLAAARSVADLDPSAKKVIQTIIEAEALVIGSPTYKGSYTGLFKHVFDLLDPADLRGKPVILTATGGGDRHSLVVEHQLRPLFAFFEAFVLPTAIYASSRDFTDGIPSTAILGRVNQALAEASVLVKARSTADAIAAE